jgi:RNA polymerase sporulation-specific sigma factor
MNYSDFNDYELIEYANENNEDANNILIKKYEPLIHSIANRMLKSCSYIGLEESDLVQEGMIGLNHAISYFNEQKDIIFYTYAKTCIERRMISTVIAAKRLKHRVLNESISLNADNDDVSFDKILKDEASNPEKIVMDSEETDKLIEDIKGTLTDFELQVLYEYEKGKTYAAIAEKLNTKIKSVDTAIQRIRKKANKIKENIG